MTDMPQDNAPAGAKPEIQQGRRPYIGLFIAWAVPVLKRWGRGFADWLVGIGWWKFFLLSMLLLILAGVTFSFLASSGAGGGQSRAHSGTVTVNVHIVPLPDGALLIQPAEPSTGKRPAKTARKRRDADDDVLLQIDGEGDADNPSVRIDKQGVRILADENGGKAAVVIDHNGVRVEKLPRDATAQKGSGAAPAAGAATVGPGVLVRPSDPADPEKVATAVEAARSQIESMLQDQVDDKLAALDEGDRTERENWLELLATMFIISLIILKLVLGSKSRAESRARQASETAAQEGLKRQLAEAQLKMMQAQVEPHFLFNTLASVDYLIETDPARASRMQKNLIQYLRAALPQMREGISTLGREIAQVRSYLEILKVRMDERLQFSINVPQGLLSASFPPMMLLTLVENAIKHGLEPKSDGGSVAVSAVVADGRLRVAVADTGLGFGAAKPGGTGVGLANVRERLRALFGPAASLVIDANADGGTIATIVVPYRIEASAGAPAGEARTAVPAA